MGIGCLAEAGQRSPIAAKPPRHHRNKTRRCHALLIAPCAMVTDRRLRFVVFLPIKMILLIRK